MNLPCGSLFLHQFGKPSFIDFSIQLHLDLHIKIIIHKFYTKYVADRFALGKCQEHYLLVRSRRPKFPYIQLCGDVPTPYGLTVLTHIAHISSVHIRDPPHILCLLTYEGLIKENLRTIINSYEVRSSPTSTNLVVNPSQFRHIYDGRNLAFATIFICHITGIFGHSTIIHMTCLQCCDDDFAFLSINEVYMKNSKKLMLCAMSNGNDYLDGYTWQFPHKNSISYMVNSQSETVVFFKIWTEPLASRIYNLSNEMPSLSFNINTNITRGNVFYRKYTIQSDSFIKIRFKDVPKFSGYTYECVYGGIAVLPSESDLNHVADIYCSNETIYPLIGDIKELYSNRHDISLVFFSYVDYFHINITVEATRTECEGWS